MLATTKGSIVNEVHSVSTVCELLDWSLKHQEVVQATPTLWILREIICIGESSCIPSYETQCHFPYRVHAIHSMNENILPQMKGARNFELPKLYEFFHNDLNNY